MQLKPFLLDAWLDQYEHDIEFNLAASTGPVWTVNDILALADEETRHRFLNHDLVYSRPAGADSLREAIAEMQQVPIDAVQVTTGASEGLVALMWLAAEPGANVILPLPGYPPFAALPESLGLETRFYRVRRENGFRIDPDEIKRLADSNTKLILVNSPHNPTGATISDEEMEALHDFTAKRGIQLVSDEVYHPIYHGRPTKSAARLPHVTVISDLSKAFSLAGVRTGWMIEHDAQRRQQYWTARAYFSISNSTTGEILSEIAIRRRDVVLGKAQETAARNLKLLEGFMAESARGTRMDSAERRDDGVPLAGEFRKCPASSAKPPPSVESCWLPAIASICRRISAWALPQPEIISPRHWSALEHS